MAVNGRFCGLFACFGMALKPRATVRIRARFYALESGLQRGCFLPDFADRRTMDGQTDGQQTDIFCVEKVGLRGVFVSKFSRNSAKLRK
jgi:hypothetical protein